MEKINSKNTIKQLREDLIKRFVEDKVTGEEFSERQKGLISGWLDEAMTLGCAIGEKEGFVNSNPEAMDKIIEIVTSAFGNKEDSENLASELLSKLRWVVKNQNQTIGWYESMLDDLIADKFQPKFMDFACR